MKTLTSFRGCRGRGRWLVTLALVLVGGCAASTTRRLETGVAQALVSPDQENQIGLQLKTDFDTKQGGSSRDPSTVEYGLS